MKSSRVNAIVLTLEGGRRMNPRTGTTTCRPMKQIGKAQELRRITPCEGCVFGGLPAVGVTRGGVNEKRPACDTV